LNVQCRAKTSDGGDSFSAPRPFIRSAKTPIAERSNNEISVDVHRKKQ
jgi:hypothetical protein